MKTLSNGDMIAFIRKNKAKHADRPKKSVGVFYLFTAEQFLIIRRGVLLTPAGEHSSPLPYVRCKHPEKKDRFHGLFFKYFKPSLISSYEKP